MLNEGQQKVALHDHGAILVIAGAGTGKTRTLTHRFAHLVSKGTVPERILLLTFTRKAAGEMQERAATLLNEQGIYSNLAQTGGTFHSVAFKWLRKFGKIDSGFSIVDEKDLKSLMKISLTDEQRSELTAASLTLKDLLQIRSLSVNLQTDIETVTARFFPASLLYMETISQILRKLEEDKDKSGMFDYDDILLQWLNLLNAPEGEIIRNAYDYVMVDEYQDTSRIKVDILKGLVRSHGNIMAVGDDCQSIYSFRGALADQMRDFEKDFEDSAIVKLEENYRSSQEILNFCNDVIAESRDVYPKELQSAVNKQGPRPLLVKANDEEDVAYRLVQKILDNLSLGIPLDQQAVLFRSSMQAMTLERRLGNENISYKKFGGIKLTESAHTRDFLSIISCCFCKNAAAWLRTLKMLPGVGIKTAAKALTAVEDGLISEFKFPASAEDASLELINLVTSQPTDNPDPHFIEGCLNWYKSYLFKEYDNASTRLYELNELCTQLNQVESLSEFAAEILLDSFEVEEDEYETSLVLSTIHSAKGKEWDCVYIVNVSDGAIPIKRPTVDLEEERRLLYVAMTRAKEQLYLYWPSLNRNYTSNNLSPFLMILDEKEKREQYDPYTVRDQDEPDDLFYVYDDSGIF